MSTLPVEVLNATFPTPTLGDALNCSQGSVWAPSISDRVKVTARPGTGIVDVNLLNVEIALTRVETVTLVEELLEAIKRAEA
ncbi:hypothetical protein [Nocardioides sp.]|uniref:hypothetical protein n=1 Tax=Nocardioides sp. TaxID=35761 RepID=UPI00261A4BB7|nr:hypothetical protein [Nocardioides sp.]